MSEDRNTQRDIAQGKVNNEIMLALGRLEGKMDGVLDGQKALFKITGEHDRRIGDNEDALDNIKLKVGLAGAFIGAVFSAIGNWIWRKFTGH